MPSKRINLSSEINSIRAQFYEKEDAELILEISWSNRAKKNSISSVLSFKKKKTPPFYLR